jgi:hypothetical protein
MKDKKIKLKKTNILYQSRGNFVDYGEKKIKFKNREIHLLEKLHGRY